MDDAGREVFNRLLSRGEPWSSHQKRMRKNGERMEATVTVSPVQDEGGRVMNYVAVVRDVTQEERLRQQMTQSQKLEALGTLAGGIAHDLKNIFTPIVLNIEMALEDVGRSREARPMLEEALQAARMGADLTRQIVIFSRRTPQEMRPVKVLPVVQEALQILRSTLPPGVDLSLKAEARDAVVVADPTQLTQVVLNLGSNAGHAMKEGGGTLDVTVTSSDLDEHGAEAVSPRFPLGRYVCIVFRDTGIGMDEETLEHIFEPFYTTKAKGEGSGMGLAVVHGIVRDHKGAVTVKSRPGEGSVFRVLLPMAGG
jgi:signal transduction histidine kinase